MGGTLPVSSRNYPRRLNRVPAGRCFSTTICQHAETHFSSRHLNGRRFCGRRSIQNRIRPCWLTGEGNQISVLERTPLPHSLGQFYAAMTAFRVSPGSGIRYIVMGLASSGELSFAPTLVARFCDAPRWTIRTEYPPAGFPPRQAGHFVREFIRLFGPPRRPQDEITQRHRDLAASAIRVGRNPVASGGVVRSLTQATSLCPAGGD